MTDTAATLEQRLPGRTRILRRALTKIVAAVAADTLGVEARQVNVGLRDEHGRLALTVASPIRIASLQQILQRPDALESTGGSLTARATLAQTTIRDRVSTLTGSEIGHITVVLTGTVAPTDRRVA